MLQQTVSIITAGNVVGCCCKQCCIYQPPVVGLLRKPTRQSARYSEVASRKSLKPTERHKVRRLETIVVHRACQTLGSIMASNSCIKAAPSRDTQITLEK